MGWQLLKDRRFGPLFFTQALGAFNDNLFKNALVLLFVFQGASLGPFGPNQLAAIAGALILLPFFLFSANAGLLADRMDKARLVRWTKTAEIVIMLAGAVGLLMGSAPILLVTLFLMGAQSTLFGPVKLSLLPVHLREEELVTGNALVELGTFLAILGGTLVGGALIGAPQGVLGVAGGVLLVAALGRLAAQGVPAAPPPPDAPAWTWSPITPNLDLWRAARSTVAIWNSILGLSWFWLFGAVVLTLFPAYTRDVLHGAESLATLFLAIFSVGIGLGSMVCERLSRERLELGLVPFGTLGMTLFAGDLAWVGSPLPPAVEPWSAWAFLQTWGGWRIAVDLLLLAAFGGLLVVPLTTLLQQRAVPSERSRVIAAMNVITSFFMVLGQLALVVLAGWDVSPVAIFGGMAVLNLLVGLYMYSVVPEFLLRFVCWCLSFLVYRLEVVGHRQIPAEGPCVLVCNHVSFVDWFVLAAAIRRPARFVMWKGFFNLPVVKLLFRQAKVIPIGSGKEDPAALERSFDQISAELRDGQVVCIFPEGTLTNDGEMLPFRKGIERIVARDPVPVVPMALNGLWGSYFSRAGKGALKQPFRRFYSRIALTIGAPVPPGEVSADGLQERVRALWREGLTRAGA